MLEAIKQLIDSGIVNEDTKTQIQEAWEKRIAEAKDEAKAELRQEFANRYEHDKAVMVEAVEKMVNESLKEEIEEFAKDKRRLAEERVAFKKYVNRTGKQFQNFLVAKLSEEIKELRNDRKNQAVQIGKLEKFVINALAEELTDFAKDKKDLAETKVKLLTTAKTKLAEVRKQFIQRGAKVVKEQVSKNLQAELKQFKNDIKLARENMFGRKIYETFATEFAMTHLNENEELKKLKKELESKNKVIAESKKVVTQQRTLLENAKRDRTMDDLLGTLTKEKRGIMRELLENVQTPKLRSAFDKYLPAVLSGTRKSTSMLTEGKRKEVTGDKKTATQAQNSEGSKDLTDIRHLAGLNK